MRIVIADKTYELGSGHEVREVVLKYDEHGDVVAFRMYDERRQTLLAVRTKAGKADVWAGKRADIDAPVELPVGVYEIK